MAQINFYHTAGDTPAALDAALPALLTKILATGSQTLVVCPTPARASRLDETLWTYADTAFLPHGTLEAAHPDHQPILITHTEAEPVPPSSRLPLILSGAESFLQSFNPSTLHPKLLYLFTSAQADVTRARPLFKSLKEQGHTVTYFQQNEKGWAKKA